MAEGTVKRVGLCEGMDEMVRDIDMGELEEDKSLEVIYAMMCQMTRSVKKCHDVTNEGNLVIFNATKFVAGLDRVRNFVLREFPPADQEPA